MTTTNSHVGVLCLMNGIAANSELGLIMRQVREAVAALNSKELSRLFVEPINDVEARREWDAFQAMLAGGKESWMKISPFMCLVGEILWAKKTFEDDGQTNLAGQTLRFLTDAGFRATLIRTTEQTGFNKSESSYTLEIGLLEPTPRNQLFYEGDDSCPDH